MGSRWLVVVLVLLMSLGTMNQLDLDSGLPEQQVAPVNVAVSSIVEGIRLPTSEHLPLIRTDDQGERASVHSRGGDVEPYAVSYDYAEDIPDYDCMSSSDTTCFGQSNYYLVDAVSGVAVDITVHVRENGAASTGSFTVAVQIVHADTIDLVLYSNSTTTSLAISSTTTVTFRWFPLIAGNHSILASVVNSGDTNPNNDVLFETLAVAWSYDRLENTDWTPVDHKGGSVHWGKNTDRAISGTEAWKIPAGTTTDYGSGWNESLVSPEMDFSWASSDMVVNFWIHGEVAAGDGIWFEAKDANGDWYSILSGIYDATIDATIDDSSNSWSFFQILGQYPGILHRWLK